MDGAGEPGASGSAGGPRVGALVLAAGASARLGRPKQLVVYRGEPLVRRAAAAAAATGANPIVVVLGAHAAEVTPALAGLAGVTVVTHDEWSRGLASSLAAGVRTAAAAAACDGLLVTLCDQPLVDAAALRALLAAFDGPRSIVAAEYEGTVGVPAVIGRAYFDELTQLSGDAGAGRWLRARLPAVTRVPLPAAAVDVDTLDDVARLEPRD
jgi:CTP:molybdopterin cytidylyltransferase MocA